MMVQISIADDIKTRDFYHQDLGKPGKKGGDADAVQAEIVAPAQTGWRHSSHAIVSDHQLVTRRRIAGAKLNQSQRRVRRLLTLRYR